MSYLFRNKCFTYLFNLTFFLSWFSYAQKKVIQPVPDSFVKDDSLNIVVWNPSETPILNSNQINFGLPENSYESSQHVLGEVLDSISYSLKIRMLIEASVVNLYTTKYPIIHIIKGSEILDTKKTSAVLHYYGKDTTFINPIGIEHRGNISLSFPKKSYDIEFREDSLSSTSKNVKFKGMRKDDDYVLDAMYNEPLRMRAFLAQNLWLDIHELTYKAKEPKAKSGVDAKYVEVFVDHKYKGIFLLSEQVDRKLLKIKKKKRDTVKGELFKAGYYRGATGFTEAPEFKNHFPTWGGFVMKYPYEDYTSHWDDISQAIDLVVNGTTNKFITRIEEHFDINNVIDYYLFINLIRGTDNLGKNYYLARYDEKSPYFIIPWDLDGTWGVVIDGRHMNITTDILTNGLLERLWNENPNQYRSKVSNRWKELRSSYFSDEALLLRIKKKYTTLQDHLIYERESLVWDNTFTKEQLEYMTTWLQKRTVFLDSRFIFD